MPLECKDPNEKFEMCGPAESCVRTCDNPEGNMITCPPICEMGCFCVPGFVRGPQGDCISFKDCPYI